MTEQIEYFKNAKDAGNWISKNGYMGRRGIISERMARLEVSKLKKDHENGYSFAVIKKLADKTWGGKTEAIPLTNDASIPSLVNAKERILLAEAGLKEFRLKEQEGKMIDAAEAERRQVCIILGIKRHFETNITDRIITFISKIKTELPEELQGVLNAHTPELIEYDRELVADIFDGLAQKGGVDGCPDCHLIK